MVISVDKQEDLLEGLVIQFQEHIDYFFQKLDLQSLRELLQHYISHPGTLFFTGVGKSGIIARKIAMTISSSGSKAFFLSPVDALHGDVGLVSKGDTVIFLSKSGESDELIQLCPVIRNKGAHLIAVVSASDSRLCKACNYTLVLPVIKELCPFDTVPTTSTLVQLIFGDLFAIALMQINNFTLDKFAQNHPSGQLGRRLTFTVSELMMTEEKIPLANPNEKLVDKLIDFSDKQCGCLIIVDEEKHLLGIFTDGDLRRSLQEHSSDIFHKTLGDLMTKTPKNIHMKAFAIDAMKVMESNQKRPITVLPVIDNDRKVVGILRMHDIIQSGI